MAWEECVLLRKEKGKVQHLFRKTQLHCSTGPPRVRTGGEREDPSGELGEMLNASDRCNV